MRKVCLTMIFDDYDDIKDPNVMSDGWDYFVITDKLQGSLVWEDVIYKDEGDPKMKMEHVLTKPWDFIDFDVCAIIGGQIELGMDLNKVVMTHDMSVPKHPTRDCVYQEANACIMLGKDDTDVINEQMDRYEADGYPEGNGMVQTGITFRKYTEAVVELGDMWWNQVNIGSKRDQLSFNYCCHKLGFEYQELPAELLGSELLRIHKHNK